MRLRAVTIAFALMAALFAPFSALADDNTSVEATVRAYFADLPVMIAIAKCESNFRQFNASGGVLYGGWHDDMIGIFQIAGMHSAEAKAAGYDITTVAGNIIYAKQMYEEQGTAPWQASYDCWKDAPSPSGTVAVADTGETDTAITSLQQQVAQLQAALKALLASRADS